MFVELFFILGALYILCFGGFRHPFHSFLAWVISWFVSFIIITLIIITILKKEENHEKLIDVMVDVFLPGIACVNAFILEKMGNFQQ